MATENTSFKCNDILAPPLTIFETKKAVKDLIINPYPKVNRKFSDPLEPGSHKFFLFSFIPTEKAVPDKNGLYGIGKIRGTFTCLDDANDRAIYIVQNIDSVNKIFTGNIGIPFPIVKDGYSLEKKEIVDEMQNEISKDVRRKLDEERKIMKEMENRKKALLDDIDMGDSEEDIYVTNRVKLAHLSATIDDYEKKILDCIDAKIKCKQWLINKHKEFPDFEKSYYEKYMSARRNAHIPDTEHLPGFMKYLNESLQK